jgi:nucleoid DNA-binding protein
VTKVQFIKLLHSRLNGIFPLRDLIRLIELTNAWIKKKTLAGEVIEISSIGTFCAKLDQKNPKMIFFSKGKVLK